MIKTAEEMRVEWLVRSMGVSRKKPEQICEVEITREDSRYRTVGCGRRKSKEEAAARILSQLEWWIKVYKW